MQKQVWAALSAVLAVWCMACNHGMSPPAETGEKKTSKNDLSQRTVIDNSEYIDFTTQKYNARVVRKEEMLYALNGAIFKNDNSSIQMKSKDGTIELLSDSGVYNGKNNCQIYGVFGFDIQAASDDCLYIRKDHKKEGFLMIDGTVFRNDAMPDLAVCLPLYGYSRNRIEVSTVMDGYIVMPSGTYWKNK